MKPVFSIHVRPADGNLALQAGKLFVAIGHESKSWSDQNGLPMYGFGSGIYVQWGLWDKQWLMNWIPAEKMFANRRIYET